MLVHKIMDLSEVSFVCTIDQHGANDVTGSLLSVSLELLGCKSGVEEKYLLTSQKAHQAAGFRSMKRLGVFLLPPGWNASPSHGYPQHFAGTHLYMGGERHRESKVSCPRTQHNVPGQGTTRSGVEHSNHDATAPPTSV